MPTSTAGVAPDAISDTIATPTSGSGDDGFGAGSTALIDQYYSGGTYHFSGNQDIDGVLIGSRWTIPTLSYSFPTSGTVYGNTYTDGRTSTFDPFTAQQQTGMLYALGLVASYTNLSFTPTTETATTHADLRFGRTRNTTDVPTAQGKFPASYAYAGDVWLGETNQPFYLTPAKGNWGQAIEMHELGHALGLKHGQTDYTTTDLHAGGYLDSPGAGAPRYGSAPMPAAHDGQDWSLMTYQSDPGNSPTVFEGDGIDQPQTYMQDDIAALQYLYGANFGTNSGDTVYSWSPTTGEEFINGVGQGAPTGNKISMTVWDGGGNDTYDLSNYTTDLSIDLRPGQFSTFSAAQLVNHRARTGGDAPAVGNVANALLYDGDPRSLIENAIGGSGNDTIIGNAADNVLTGGLGTDQLTGGGGHDTFKDTAAGLAGDTITDFSASDDIWITDAALGSLTFSYDPTLGVLSFAEGALATDTVDLSAGLTGDFGASADAGGGVDLALLPAPILSGIAAVVQGTEQTPLVLAAGATLTDAEADAKNAGQGDYAGATLTIARDGGADAEDLLGLATDGTAFGAGDGVLSASGKIFGTYADANGTLTIAFTSAGTPATTALVEAVLRAVTYTNGSDDPPATVALDYAYTGPAGADFTASAGTAVDIGPVNDPPSAAAPQAAYGVTAGQSLALKGTGLTVADPDGGSGIETASLTVSEGTLAAAAGDSGASVTGSGTSTVSIMGTIAQIDALLGAGGTGTLDFQDAAADPAVALMLAIDDNGNTGGGALRASASATIVVTAPAASPPPTPPPASGSSAPPASPPASNPPSSSDSSSAATLPSLSDSSPAPTLPPTSSSAPASPPTNQLPSPAIAFDPTVGFTGPNAATLTGTASDPSGIAGVEIFQGSTDLGAATVDQGAGTWSFAFDNGPGLHTGLTALATAGDGLTASAPSLYDLTTGIRGRPYTARQDSYDTAGDLVGQTFFRQRGAIYLQTTTTTNPDGSSSVLTTGGGYFARLPYFAIQDDFGAAGRPTEEDVYYKDGHQTVQGLVGHQSLDSIADDTFIPTGKGNSFVFTPGFGQDTITAFNLAGPGHDTISLPEGAAARLGAILAGATTDAAGNAVLQINPHDAITVEGVSAADLSHNRRDFTFHA